MSRLLWLFLACFFCAAIPARAQPPSSVQPGQVMRSLDLRPTLRSETSRPPVMKEEPRAQARPGGPSFVLKHVALTGTVYSQKQVNDAVAPWLGKEVDLAALDDVAAALTAKYHADGYMLSHVLLPAGQRIENGAVRFEAIEGYVSDVVFQGETAGKEKFLKAAAERIKSARPLRLADTERAMLLLNDLPGVSAQSLLRPSSDTPDASQMVIVLGHHDFDSYASFDNRGSRFLGPWQATVSAALNGLFGLDRTALRGVTSVPGDELRFIELSHDRVLSANGLKASFRAAASGTAPGGSVEDLDISGYSRLGEAAVSYPFLRTRRASVTGYAGFRALNASSDLLGQRDSWDHVRTAYAGGACSISDSFGGTTRFDVQARQGLDVLYATHEGPMRSRANGDQTFLSFQGSGSRLQRLYGNFSALLSWEWQYARDALLAPEEFALGGAGFGRAYDAAEITGDHGVAGSFELRYTDFPENPSVSSWQLYGFYDGGAVWNRDRVALESRKESLASTGGGLRLGFTQGFDTEFELAAPLTRPVVAEGDDKALRAFVRIGKSF